MHIDPTNPRSLAVLVRRLGDLPRGRMVGLLSDVCAAGLLEVSDVGGRRLSEVVAELDGDAAASACAAFFMAEGPLFTAAYRWWLGFVAAGNFHLSHGGYDAADYAAMAPPLSEALGEDVTVADAPFPVAPEERAAAELAMPSLDALAEAAARFAPRRRFG
jgi:hypothetical protein